MHIACLHGSPAMHGILYSGKIWRALNLANPSSERIGETTNFTSACALLDNDFDYDVMNSQLTGRLAVLPIQRIQLAGVSEKRLYSCGGMFNVLQ